MAGIGALRGRRAGIAAAVAAAAVLASACGTAGGNGTEVRAAGPDEVPAGYLTQVADTTQASSTGRFEGEFTSTINSGRTGPYTISGTQSGAFDLTARHTHMTMTASGGPGLDLTMEAILDNDIAYQRSPVLARIDPALGDKWLRFDLSGLPIELEQTELTDPSTWMELLRSTGTPIDELGHEEVHGADTRHLRTSVSFDDLLARIPADKRDELERLPGLSTLKGVDGARVDLHVYVDGDDRVRRIVTDASPGSSSKVTGTMHQQIDFFDLGQPVTIAVPAAEDSIDGTDLLTSARSGGRSTTTTTSG